MKLDSKTASFYYSRPSEHLDGRQAVVPCANILGGGSSINFMVLPAHIALIDSAPANVSDVHPSFSL